MTKVLVVSDRGQLGQFAEMWNRLRKQYPFVFPSFDDLAAALSQGTPNFRLCAIKDGDRISSLACFICERSQKGFTVGERKLFSVPVRRVRLFGSAVLGDADPDALKQFLKVVVAEFDFDLIAFGEIPIDSPLYSAIHGVGSTFIVTSPRRKQSLRWLIKIPETFDRYLETLSSKLRKSMRYQIRKLENELKCELVVVHRPEQVDTFLRDGEAISRMTYQWNVGQRLNNDDATRSYYKKRAAEGQLRCYLVSIAGKPVAFARGFLVDGVYKYDTPGFDPQYTKFSVGSVLLLWTIRDLIENTDCKVFDFGEGGAEDDYKSRFGNISVRCASLELIRWTRPMSLAVVILQEGLTAAKNCADWALGQNKLRTRLRKAIRKYGDAHS